MMFASTSAPSESPSWVTVTPGAEPKEQPSTWGVWVELQRLLGLGTLPTGATQADYRRFHASAWVPRLRCVLLALSLLTIAELASELSTPDAFCARLRSRHPTEGQAALVLAVLLRCCAVGVTATSTITRWPPLQSLLTRRCPLLPRSPRPRP
jgi:hypothetical protein